MRTVLTLSSALVLVALAAPAAAQRVVPSVYIGGGSYTNLGGEVGIGTEIRIGDDVAVSGAVGYLREESPEEPAEPRRDYDIGLKVYPLREWLYLGLNYGLVDYWLDGRVSPPSIERTHAFSFTVGARTPAWRRLYASAFFGTTSDAESNEFFDSFMPRIGLMLGYELRR